MSEFIPLSELEKKEYEKFFLSFNEGKVQKYYGHPGQWNYVCPPTEWRTAKVNTYLWGRFVSSEKLNPLLEETEDKNGFFASSNFWLSPGHRSDVKEELQTKGTHAYISPLYGRDIVQQRREDGIIKTVTNEEYMKPGDFLFVIENEGTYSFQHTGMFDMFGRVFETGFNAVEHFNELAKDNQYHFIRIYDGADVMSVAQRKDTWNEQFKGKSVEEVVSKLDKEMDILEAKKEGGAFISLLPHRPGSFMYTNSKDVISKEGFQYELQNR